MSTPIIDIDGLTKVYPRQIGQPARKSLDDLRLRIGANEIFGFLGQNGAGKTTTIKILCSVLRATKGAASVCGHDVRTRAARGCIGYLPENPYFYEYLTPRETIDFYGRLQGLDRRTRAREWDALSERLDLHGIGAQRIRGFSKGMRQRLGFAVALVGDPPVLILDEPMSGLDPLGRRMIRELILSLRAAGKTIFFSSHVLGDVEQICDRVGILVEGRLRTQGRIDELLNRRNEQVELVVSGLSAETADALARDALHARRSEAGLHLTTADAAAANAMARAALSEGGQIVEFTPIRESLEAYFVKEQAS